MARLLVVRQRPDEDDIVSRLPGLGDLYVEHVTGAEAALARLSAKAFDVLLMSPTSTLEQDLEFLEQARQRRPGIRAIFLAHSATPESVLAALQAEVFAVFTRPFDPAQIANLVTKAAEADGSPEHGIRVLGATPDWVTLRVSAHLVTADRVVAFMDQLHRRLFDGPEMDHLLVAFREILLNAIEHGAGLDPEKDIRVDAIRTKRALTFYFRDPGPGFVPGAQAHAATGHDPLSHIKRRMEAGLRPGGYGMLLSTRLVDEVIYSHAGNEVLMVKHLS